MARLLVGWDVALAHRPIGQWRRNQMSIAHHGGMVRQTKGYKPRERSARPLVSGRAKGALPPASPYPMPEHKEGGWYVPPPHSLRLHQKSAFGFRCKDEGILLTAVELLYCHWYRFIPLPEPKAAWFAANMLEEPQFEAHAIAMELMRNSHDLCVPVAHLTHRLGRLPEKTWAMGWPRGSAWMKTAPETQVRVQRTSDAVDWFELLNWFDGVSDQGQRAMLCVIDDEMEGTVYSLNEHRPKGDHRTLSSLSSDAWSCVKIALDQAVVSETVAYVPTIEEWPLPSVGVEHFSGRTLGLMEYAMLREYNPSSSNKSLQSWLIEQGLMLRPGFKYGSLWRAYERPIGEEHAPWLIQPVELAPLTWDGVCLAARLAEGVHKTWLCAFPNPDENGWRTLSIARRS